LGHWLGLGSINWLSGLGLGHWLTVRPSIGSGLSGQLFRVVWLNCHCLAVWLGLGPSIFWVWAGQSGSAWAGPITSPSGPSLVTVCLGQSGSGLSISGSIAWLAHQLFSLGLVSSVWLTGLGLLAGLGQCSLVTTGSLSSSVRPGSMGPPGPGSSWSVFTVWVIRPITTNNWSAWPVRLTTPSVWVSHRAGSGPLGSTGLGLSGPQYQLVQYWATGLGLLSNWPLIIVNSSLSLPSVWVIGSTGSVLHCQYWVWLTVIACLGLVSTGFCLGLAVSLSVRLVSWVIGSLLNPQSPVRQFLPSVSPSVCPSVRVSSLIGQYYWVILPSLVWLRLIIRLSLAWSLSVINHLHVQYPSVWVGHLLVQLVSSRPGPACLGPPLSVCLSLGWLGHCHWAAFRRLSAWGWVSLPGCWVTVNWVSLGWAGCLSVHNFLHWVRPSGFIRLSIIGSVIVRHWSAWPGHWVWPGSSGSPGSGWPFGSLSTLGHRPGLSSLLPSVIRWPTGFVCLVHWVQFNWSVCHWLNWLVSLSGLVCPLVIVVHYHCLAFVWSVIRFWVIGLTVWPQLAGLSLSVVILHWSGLSVFGHYCPSCLSFSFSFFIHFSFHCHYWVQ